jgi:uncharacterized membrane protein YphA (DoxX/SURF4 family)
VAPQPAPLFQIGRWFFAVAIAFFGFQYLFHGHYLGGLPPVPPWAPGGAPGAYVVGFLLLAAAVGMTTSNFGRTSALLVGGLFLLCVLVLHSPHIRDIFANGTDRTRALEPLSLAGAAFVLAALLGRDAGSTQKPVPNPVLRRLGILLFALPMLIFGYQHFEYLRFLVTLVPSWMPAHTFLIMFTGAGFIAAGLAILFGILAKPAAIWLGIMFFLWTILLHAPRIAHSPHNPDEWTSGFVALGMCGASWIMAESFAPAPAS